MVDPIRGASDALPGALPPFPVAPFELRSDSCLNARHRAGNCTRCREVCPVAAITLSGERPAVDPVACVRCGVCVVACPTKVFAETAAPEGGIMPPKSPHRPLELFCREAIERQPDGAETVESRVAGAAGRQAPRCLAALPAMTLLALSRLGAREVWLNDAPCARCPLGAAHRQLLEHVREANAWLDNAGRTAVIQTYTRNPDALSTPPTRQPAAAPAVFSRRRAFFQRLLAPPGRPGGVAEGAPGVPASRRRLLAVLRPLPRLETPLDSRSLPVTDIALDTTACTGCGLCAPACPTGALTFLTADDEAAFGLYFRPGHCIDCGLCAVACPEQAIAYRDDSLDAATLFDEATVPLHAAPLKDCRGCPAQIAAGGGHDHCHICRQGTTRPAYLHAP